MTHGSPGRPRTIRVLYVIDTLEVGGAEQSLLDLVRRLQRVEPVVCRLYPGRRLEPLFPKACPVLALDLPGKYSLFRAVSSLLRTVRSVRPALIHSALFRSNLVVRIVGRLSAVPVVNTLVSDSYAQARIASMDAGRGRRHRGVLLLDRATARYPTRYTANSCAVRSASCSALGIPPEKVRVIYRGRDASVFHRTAVATAAPSGLQGILETGGRIIINVGRLVESKGQADLIAAMPGILGRHPDAVLVLAGEGERRSALEAGIDALRLRGKVILLGERSDIPALLQAAEIFASASCCEGLPGAVVEAMLTGLPVALSGIDVHREMVQDGVTGRLFSPGDSGGITEALCSLLASPAASRAMGDRARERAAMLFDIGRVAEQHEEFYAEVLDRWRGRN